MKTNEDGSTTYTQDDIAAMPKEDVINVLLGKVKIKGTAVLKDKDGNIKYDDDATPGDYGEDQLEIAS